eukprot:CAMPEP_0180277308 /NCGR_PEP_ID=MMETSP0988-20121125/6857_1 /TAXON_ID=697907 /ORGANISM="non described non described, Strain CCMP2293" /LENGTH=421 /DNA_ID=CAMNT_0022248733 /DNA_START=207 /DNA_END=1471 /DNA_ORIENTATION=+
MVRRSSLLPLSVGALTLVAGFCPAVGFISPMPGVRHAVTMRRGPVGGLRRPGLRMQLERSGSETDLRRTVELQFQKASLEHANALPPDVDCHGTSCDFDLFEESELQAEVSTQEATPAAAAEADDGKFWTRILVLVIAMLYGTNFGSVKILQQSLDVPVAAAARFAVASVAMLPFIRGLRLEALGDMVIIGALAAAWDGAAWRAVALAIAGAAVLELGGASPPTTGDAWALVQPLAFGAGFWKTEQLIKKYPDQATQIPAVQVITVGALATVWAAVDASLKGVEVSTLVGQVGDGMQNPQILAALLWTGLVTTALTVFLEVKALKELSSAETTVLFATEPLWGAAFAYVALQEHVGPETFMGGALILAACGSRTVNPTLIGAKLKETMEYVGVEGQKTAGRMVLAYGSVAAFLQRLAEDIA